MTTKEHIKINKKQKHFLQSLGNGCLFRDESGLLMFGKYGLVIDTVCIANMEDILGKFDFITSDDEFVISDILNELEVEKK